MENPNRDDHRGVPDYTPTLSQSRNEYGVVSTNLSDSVALSLQSPRNSSRPYGRRVPKVPKTQNTDQEDSVNLINRFRSFTLCLFLYVFIPIDRLTHSLVCFF